MSPSSAAPTYAASSSIGRPTAPRSASLTAVTPSAASRAETRRSAARRSAGVSAGRTGANSAAGSEPRSMPVGSPCSSRSMVAPAGVGRRRRDPRDGEGEGVRHDGVTAAVVQEDRDIGGRRVQLVPRWIAAVGPGRGVVDRLHPAVGIRPGSRRQRTDRVQRGAPVGGRREVEPAEADPLAERVSVRVLEARQDGAAPRDSRGGSPVPPWQGCRSLRPRRRCGRRSARGPARAEPGRIRRGLVCRTRGRRRHGG